LAIGIVPVGIAARIRVFAMVFTLGLADVGVCGVPGMGAGIGVDIWMGLDGEDPGTAFGLEIGTGREAGSEVTVIGTGSEAGGGVDIVTGSDGGADIGTGREAGRDMVGMATVGVTGAGVGTCIGTVANMFPVADELLRFNSLSLSVSAEISSSRRLARRCCSSTVNVPMLKLFGRLAAVPVGE
jgi:hypothetical protein